MLQTKALIFVTTINFKLLTPYFDKSESEFLIDSRISEGL